MDRHTRALVIDFIDRSFRDVADTDYISARVCYRLNLKQQFLWASLQAVEKYLKAILLYNDHSTKGLGHRIQKAYSRLGNIRDIPFDIPQDVQRFIGHLDAQGANRYFEFPYYTSGDELLLLDKAVWYIRRYCQFFSREIESIHGKQVDLLKVKLREIHSSLYKTKPNRLRVNGGLLEKILDQRRSGIRRELILKNFWYGSYTKHKIRNFTAYSGSGHPTHFLHPQVFSELAKNVKFSHAIQNRFATKKAKSSLP